MKRKNIALTLCSLVIFLFVLGCGHEQQLVSIAVSPGSGGAGPLGAVIPVQYTAIGTYIHPPKTVDLTSQVKWTSSVADVATINSSGLVVPTGIACGSTTITATAEAGAGAGIVTGKALFTVIDPNVAGCPTTVPAASSVRH